MCCLFPKLDGAGERFENSVDQTCMFAWFGQQSRLIVKANDAVA